MVQRECWCVSIMQISNPMNLERYEFYAQGTWHEFEFVSEGPNGSILKRVEFRPRMQIGYPFFNLAFGDWNKKEGKIDDTSITNNNDAKKVLATVATIVEIFTKQFTDVTIIAEGSTRSRTRLYQIGIVAHYQEIEKLFHIYGYINNEWQPFKKGVNYEAFAVRRKSLRFTKQFIGNEIKK